MTVNAIVLATGKKGSGKTTQIRKIAKPARRAIIADPEAKWVMDAGDVEVRGARALFDALAGCDATDPATRWRLVYRDDFKVMADAAPAAAFAVRNCTLVCDELGWICNARNLPPWLSRLAQFGRERRVNLLGTTREPQEIPDFLFSQADLIYFYRTDPGNGLDRIRRRYPDIAEVLPALPVYRFRTYGNREAVKIIGREGGLTGSGAD